MRLYPLGISVFFALLPALAVTACSDDGTPGTPQDASSSDRSTVSEAGRDAVTPPDDHADSGAPADGTSPEASTDAPLDTKAPDVGDGGPADGDARPDANNDVEPDADTGTAGDADAAADADPDASDAVRDAPLDALMCPQNTVVAYNQPGCGANAPPPYCQGPTDACLGAVCDCSGVTMATGCGFATSPFSAWGACPDGGLDAGSD